MQVTMPRVRVFLIDDDGAFDSIGEVNLFQSLMWPEAYSGYATIQMTAPVTPENSELLQKGNILWKGGRSAAIIESVTSSTSSEGHIYKVQGRTLECLLERRIVWGLYNKTGKLSEVMCDIVQKNCIDTAAPYRKIPFLVADSISLIGEEISYQKTGGSVYEALYELAQGNELGFSIDFSPSNKRLIFRVYEGQDRSSSQSGNDPVVFSDSTDDILSSSYYMNAEDYKNVALVAGEGEGTARRMVDTGDVFSKGLSRYELYVDARDIQSSGEEDGKQWEMSEREYADVLSQRGSEKLAECPITESFECQIRTYGTQYEYGKDYELGDIVTVVDTVLGIEVKARITEVEEDYSDKYEIVFTFGYSYPTLMQKIKSRIG